MGMCALCDQPGQDWSVRAVASRSPGTAACVGGRARPVFSPSEHPPSPKNAIRGPLVPEATPTLSLEAPHAFSERQIKLPGFPLTLDQIYLHNLLCFLPVSENETR